LSKERVLKRYFVSKILALSFALISLIVLVYTYHRAEVTFLGTRDHIYLKYYLISLASLFFWIILLKFKDEIILNTVLFTLSIFVGLYIVEASMNKILSSELSSDYDTRTVYGVYSDLLDQGVEAVPSVRPTVFLSNNGLPLKDGKKLFPLAGVSNIKTVYCNESGERIIYKSDKYGFRNSTSDWNDNKNLWVLVGDSFTHGACVEDEDTLASFIDKSRKGISVLSLGMGGNGPLLELASIEEYARYLEPKIVIWLYFEGNDIVANLPEELNSTILRNYLTSNFNQNLINRQPEIDARIKEFVKDSIDYRQSSLTFFLEEFIQNSKTIRLLNIRRIIGVDKHTTDSDFTSEFREVLSKANKRVEGWNGKFYFVYLPEYSRYLLDNPDSLSFRKRKEVIDFIEGLGIKVIDIHTEVFKGYDDPLNLFPRRSEPHYTPLGYRLTGQAIIDAIEN